MFARVTRVDPEEPRLVGIRFDLSGAELIKAEGRGRCERQILLRRG